MTDPLAELDAALKPYRGRFPTFTRLPAEGRPREEVLAEMTAIAEEERPRWESGHASGAVYQGDREHIDFLNRVYALSSQSNPLHLDLWPSAAKYEAEIVRMTATMLNGGDEAVGTVTSGGTESILLAVKAYRDRARVAEPNMVLPASAHAAFHKASVCFGVEARWVPLGPDFRADAAAMEAAIDDRTILVVGSTPAFPHGLVDPVGELSELARARGVGFHADACLGGFVLPWAERLGRPLEPWDFRLPGVTSMSADTHKFGYAPKGTSVVLYRDPELRHAQYFTTTEWPGGLYSSPTFAGSRPGALSAACWAALTSIGESGYLDATRRILDAAERVKEAIRGTPELQLIGDPLFCAAFRSPALDVFAVLDAMAERGWSLNGLHMPPAVHLCVTLRHTQPGVPERFAGDLRAAVAAVRDAPPREGGMAPIYGMAAAFPDRAAVAGMLRAYMDLWYRP